MLAAIAREFGMPSTVGVSVYLANDDETAGPLVSSTAWGTLFGHHLAPRSSPSTPIKSAGGREAFPPSPLILGGPAGTMTLDVPLSAPHDPNPIAHSPLIGTIEFDVEPSAPWLAEWRRAGRYRRPSTHSQPDGVDTGVRELRLPKHMQDQASPRFLRDVERERERDRDSGRDSKRSRSSDAASSNSDGMVSGDTTLHDDEYDVPGRRRLGSSPHPDISVPQIQLHGRALSSATMASSPPVKMEAHGIGAGLSDELLASPINLSLGERVDSLELSEADKAILKAELAKRGSALVMSDQLDDLEKSACCVCILPPAQTSD
jgi:hypothetical protein